MKGIVRITPDKERARSLMEMAQTSLKMIESVDKSAFPSNVVKEYYEVLRELLTALLYADGYKTIGEGAHIQLIDHVSAHYSLLTTYDIQLLKDLRFFRNKIAYEGFFVTGDYVNRIDSPVKEIIKKIQSLLSLRLKE